MHQSQLLPILFERSYFAPRAYLIVLPLSNTTTTNTTANTFEPAPFSTF